MKSFEILYQDDIYRANTINLNASENYTSVYVRKALQHHCYDFYHYPPSGGVLTDDYNIVDTIYEDAVNKTINKFSSKLLDCQYFDARPKGGQFCEITMLLAFAKSQDTVFYVTEKDGGHFGLNFIAERVGIKLEPLLFDEHTHLLDVENNLRAMHKKWKNSPRQLIVINQSFMLRSQEYNVFCQAVKQSFPSVIITCDVSHTLGLIIGGEMPNPILNGVDIIHGSTHKTFPGPQKGFIASQNKQYFQEISTVVSPGLQSNSGTAEICSLIAAMEEMEHFGRKYAKNICSNAHEFAKSLVNSGFNVVKGDWGYTNTHQIWILSSNEKSALQWFYRLHDSGIRTLAAYLPFVNQWGIRLGTNAMTRRGFTSNEFSITAKWIKNIVLDNLDTKVIAGEIEQYLTSFPLNQLAYTFPTHQAKQMQESC